MTERRWSVEDIGAAFVVRDHNGQQLAYVYFEDEPVRRSAAKLLSKDEARRIAVRGRTVVCYFAVTALTERFCQNVFPLRQAMVNL